MKYLKIMIMSLSIFGLVSLVHAENRPAEGRMLRMRPLLSSEQKEAVQEARDSGAYMKMHDILEDLDIERKDPLTEEQKEVLRDLREEGDRDAVKEQLEAWGIEAPLKMDRGMHLGQQLSEEQREALVDLRKEGDKEAVEAQLEAWGIEKPEPKLPQFFQRIFRARVNQDDAGENLDEAAPQFRRFLKRFLKKQEEQE